jgi:predicted Fe-Mo cluster-binding NifX family protein
MKTAIASATNKAEGEISEKGGRAPYYLIFDEENKLIESIKNPFAVGGGGAGFGVAKMLADKKVNKIIVGKVGDNMKGALEKAGIELIEKEGDINEALTQIK